MIKIGIQIDNKAKILQLFGNSKLKNIEYWYRVLRPKAQLDTQDACFGRDLTDVGNLVAYRDLSIARRWHSLLPLSGSDQRSSQLCRFRAHHSELYEYAFKLEAG